MAWDFAKELARHGPGSAAPAISEARAYCKYVTKVHYENFTVAALLLPRHLRPHFEAVYAWCRWADDLADETGDGSNLLNWWREELARCYEGAPRHPVTAALVSTIRQFDFPQSHFLELISAFEQDQTVKYYDTYEQLLIYCKRSANPVGHIVLLLFQQSSETNNEYSDLICTGLQLANFWQDVARDAALGRRYLPREDCERFEYSEDDFRNRTFNIAFQNLMRFEVERTRDLFRRGRPLLDALTGRVRYCIALFLAGGEAILDAIEKQNYDVWSRRPVVSRMKKMRLALCNLPAFIRR